MHTLVTGATGFIGGHVVRALLERGEEVACLVRNSEAARATLFDPRIRLLEGDLSRPDTIARALEGAGAIIHLASLLKVPWKPEFRTVNIGGTEAIARAAAAQSTPPVLVVVSSLAAAGPCPKDQPRTEAQPAEPISLYGKMKLDCERAAAAFADKVPMTFVRPPMVIGEGDKWAFELFRTVKRGRHFVPTLADHTVTLVHAADLAGALLAAKDRGERGDGGAGGRGLYYVADEVRPTYAELGALVAGACGFEKPSILRIPSFISWLAALGSELVARVRDTPTILNLDKWREGTGGSWICDASKARRELGFAPRPIEERLRETSEWYAREGWY